MRKLTISTPYLVSVSFGLIYGTLSQVAIRLHILRDLFGVMSFGFVFILPLVLGFLTLWYATDSQRKSWWFRIFAPLGTVLISLLFSLLVGWEGTICLVMAAVIYVPLASLGGIISGLILSRIDRNRLNSSWLIVILSLPLVSAYLEHYFDLPVRTNEVATQIEINAPAAVIWQNIIRVRAITEPLDGYFYRMGFPKPIEATLSAERVGGVRRASFERGLTFIETIDVWEMEHKLSFSIKSDPSSVPLTTLDEHVMVGGRYFDVLRGTYEIVELSETSSLLKLSSEVKISTRFNFYAGFWAKFLMSDIQNTILDVIKLRAEMAKNV